MSATLRLSPFYRFISTSSRWRYRWHLTMSMSSSYYVSNCLINEVSFSRSCFEYPFAFSCTKVIIWLWNIEMEMVLISEQLFLNILNLEAQARDRKYILVVIFHDIINWRRIYIYIYILYITDWTKAFVVPFQTCLLAWNGNSITDSQLAFCVQTTHSIRIPLRKSPVTSLKMEI